jgi:surface polysaccharide O-acyltransferase-like enzyme
MYVCSSHFTQSFHKEQTKEYIFCSALVHIIIIINLQVLESAQVEAWRVSENA